MSPDNGVPAAPSPDGGLPGTGEEVPPTAGERVRLPGEEAPAPGDDLALVAARFGAALRAAGVPADPGRCERFASAVTVARPLLAALDHPGPRPARIAEVAGTRRRMIDATRPVSRRPSAGPGR